MSVDFHRMGRIVFAHRALQAFTPKAIAREKDQLLHTVEPHSIYHVSRSVDITGPQKLLVFTGVRENGGAMHHAVDRRRPKDRSQLFGVPDISLVLNQVGMLAGIFYQIDIDATISLFQNVLLHDGAEESGAASH